MKNLLIFGLMSLLFITGFLGCKKEKQVPSTIVLDKTSYKQFEIAVIRTSNINLSSQFYKAVIDGQTIDVGRVDTLLVFMVPQVSPGNYKIDLNLDGKEYEATFDVEIAPTISDPSSFISGMRDIIFDISNIDTIMASVSNLSNAQEDGHNINTLRLMRDDFDALVSPMTITEKTQLAQFFKVNEPLFTVDLSIPEADSFNFFRNSIWSRLDSDVQDIILKGAQLSLSVLIAVPGLESCIGTGGNPIPCIIGLAAAGNSIRMFLAIKASNLNFMDKTYITIGSLVDDMYQRNFVLDKDVDYELDIKTTFRSIYSADVSSSRSSIQQYFQSITEVRNYWNQMKDLINNISGFITNNYSLIGNFPHPEEIQAPKIQDFASDLNYINLLNTTSDQNVTVLRQYNSNGKLVVAFTSPDTVTRNFNFFIQYNDGTVSYNTPVNATLQTATPRLQWVNQPTYGSMFGGQGSCNSVSCECDMYWQITGGIQPITLSVTGPGGISSPVVGIPNGGFLNGFCAGTYEIMFFDSRDTITATLDIP
jgi:hypothetical protein